MKSFTLFSSLLSLSSLAAAVLDNFPIHNNGNAYWINQLKTFPVPNYFWIKRPWGTAPNVCLDNAINGGFCGRYDIEVYDIYYSDCNVPWTVCRCTDAPPEMTMDVIARNIGVIPVRVRSWARTIGFYKATNSRGGGLSNWQDISVFGEYVDSTILFHEVAHNLDHWVAGNAQSWFSQSSEYQNTAASDSCVPQAYAKSTWQEHFAEIAVPSIYEENFGNIPIDASCFRKILTLVRSKISSVAKTGGSCSERFAPSPPVCMGPDARNQNACHGFVDFGGLTRRDLDEMPKAIGGMKWRRAKEDVPPKEPVCSVKAMRAFDEMLKEGEEEAEKLAEKLEDE